MYLSVDMLVSHWIIFTAREARSQPLTSLPQYFCQHVAVRAPVMWWLISSCLLPIWCSLLVTLPVLAVEAKMEDLARSLKTKSSRYGAHSLQHSVTHPVIVIGAKMQDLAHCRKTKSSWYGAHSMQHSQLL